MTNEEIQSLKLDSHEYCEYVEITESKNFDAISKRLSNPQVLTTLCKFYATLLEVGDLADTLKRAIYYSETKKTLPPLDPDIVMITEDKFPDIHERLQNEDFLRLNHAVIGMISEYAGELTSVLMSHLLAGSEIDWYNVGEEVGDGNWYGGTAANVVRKKTGITLNDILTRNIQKLAVRHGDAFSEYGANHPKTAQERLILEGKSLDDNA